MIGMMAALLGSMMGRGVTKDANLYERPAPRKRVARRGNFGTLKRDHHSVPQARRNAQKRKNSK